MTMLHQPKTARSRIPLRNEERHVVSSRRSLRACLLAVPLLAPDVTGK